MIDLSRLRDLITRWREIEETLRSHGAVQAAQATREHADQLETAINQWAEEELPLSKASELSGYSYSHLQRLVSEGTIPNAGRPGSPRIRRRDLPRRPNQENIDGDGGEDGNGSVGSRVQEARSVVDSD